MTSVGSVTFDLHLGTLYKAFSRNGGILHALLPPVSQRVNFWLHGLVFFDFDFINHLEERLLDQA